MFQRYINCILSVFVLGLLTHITFADNWPQFRGPGSLGITHAKNLPVTWSDTENLIWKTAMPGYGSSSPIALDGKLYVTCYSGYGLDRKNTGKMEDLTLHVVCVDGSNGTIIWDKRIKPELPETFRY